MKVDCDQPCFPADHAFVDLGAFPAGHKFKAMRNKGIDELSKFPGSHLRQQFVDFPEVVGNPGGHLGHYPN